MGASAIAGLLLCAVQSGAATAPWALVSVSPTTTAFISGTPSTVQYQYWASLTVTVSPTDGHGTVSFSGPSGDLCPNVPLELNPYGGNNYVASCVVNGTTLGATTVTATYSGDSLYAPSSVTTPLTVVPASTYLTPKDISIQDSVVQVSSTGGVIVLEGVWFSAQLTKWFADWLPNYNDFGGQLVSFYLADGTFVCSAVTDPNYTQANCQPPTNLLPRVLANSSFTAVYGGTTGYLSSQATGHINLVDTSLPPLQPVECVDSIISTLLYLTPPDASCQGLGILGL